jgi:ribonuclease VapC
MTRGVLDASAVIAFLFQEPGSDAVAARMAGCILSAANMVEVVSKCLKKGRTLEEIEHHLGRLPITVVAVTPETAKVAGTIHHAGRPLNLSLADTLCLALGLERRLPVITGDRKWCETDFGVEVVLFR